MANSANNVFQSPSGRLLSPLPGVGNPQYTAAAPVTFVLQPAGHEPGLYSVICTAFNVVAASAGNYACSINWRQPNFGPASLSFTNILLTIADLRFTVDRSFESDGSLPITFVMTPAGVVGSPRVSVNCSARIVARPVSS